MRNKTLAQNVDYRERFFDARILKNVCDNIASIILITIIKLVDEKTIQKFFVCFRSRKQIYCENKNWFLTHSLIVSLESIIYYIIYHLFISSFSKRFKYLFIRIFFSQITKLITLSQSTWKTLSNDLKSDKTIFINEK